MPVEYTEALVRAPLDEDIIVTTRKRKDRNESIPPFITTGAQRMVKGTLKGYPYTKTLLSLTKPEQWLYALIYEGMDYRTNKAFVPSAGFTRTEVNKLSGALQLLRKRDLVRRVQKDWYMVNPDAVFYINTYDQMKAEWDDLK